MTSHHRLGGSRPSLEKCSHLHFHVHKSRFVQHGTGASWFRRVASPTSWQRRTDKTEANEQQAAFAREFVIKVEDELQKFRHGILALMDKNLVSSGIARESKMSFYAVVGDYFRYLSELAAVEAKSKAAEDACVADTEATKIDEKFVDKAADALVVLQRQVLVIQQVQETAGVPQRNHGGQSIAAARANSGARR